MGCLVKNTCVLPLRLSPRSPQAPLYTGLCQSLLHLAKLTRLLGSPEIRHLTDLPTVSPPQVTPSLSALMTLSLCSYLCFCRYVPLHVSLSLVCVSSPPTNIFTFVTFSVQFSHFPNSHCSTFTLLFLYTFLCLSSLPCPMPAISALAWC